MNYTVPDNRPFITSGPIKTKVTLPEKCKAMNEYIDSHCFSVSLDIDTHTPIVRIAQKCDER